MIVCWDVVVVVVRDGSVSELEGEFYLVIHMTYCMHTVYFYISMYLFSFTKITC